MNLKEYFFKPCVKITEGEWSDGMYNRAYYCIMGFIITCLVCLGIMFIFDNGKINTFEIVLTVLVVFSFIFNIIQHTITSKSCSKNKN